MRSSMAYFAGAGTVIAAIAVGLGGGYMFFSIVSPHQEKHGSSEVTRLERRISQEPIQAANNKGTPEPVPYLAAPQVSAAVADTPSQPQPVPQQQQATQPQQAQPQQTQPQQASTQPAASAPPAPPAAQPVAAAEQPAAREKSAPEESWARARDADLRRDARRAEEKRKAERERRQQWSERRKLRPRDDGSELVEVERKVREETEPRRIREDSGSRRLFASEPARTEMPRIRLFDME